MSFRYRTRVPELLLLVLAAGQPDRQGSLPAPTAPAGRTILTLRATKADVDQYAKGRLNQQQFEQRLQTITY